MKMNQALAITMLALVMGACAHTPSKDEITAFRTQQMDVSRIEALLYTDKENSQALTEQLRSCAMQLHDRVNPEESFQWYETVDRHSEKDYFANPDNEMKYQDFQLLSEKYKLYKQYAMARKENYENRIKVCKSDLKSAMAHEKLRLDQERALLDSLNKAMDNRQPASVHADTPPKSEASEEVKGPVTKAPSEAVKSAAEVKPNVSAKTVED